MRAFNYLKKKISRNRKIHFIDNDKALNDFHSILKNTKIIGVDTEFDWRSTYFPSLSLIQLSLKKDLVVIDCLKVCPKKILKKYFENKEVLKVFHSARNDLTVLSKCLEIYSRNIFDIQIAEQILSPGEIKSYGRIVEKNFTIKLNKSETNSNWLRRPLSEEQIKYALDDVDYLLEIFSIQKTKLKKVKKYEEAIILSEKQGRLGNKPLRDLRLKKLKNVSKRDYDIFLWRETHAESKNIPPAFIFKDKNLNKLKKINKNTPQFKKIIMSILGDNMLTKEFISEFL